MNKVLIIDDDQELCSLLVDYLAEQGFTCRAEGEALSGLALLKKETWGAAVLDIMLPGMNGLSLLQKIRADDALKTLPVIMLTARGEETDRVVGLEMGADDYLPKPFSARELAARLRALLRRTSPSDDAPLSLKTVDDITINRAALRISIGANQTEITMSELRLLEMLTAEPGTVLGRDHLNNALFGHPAYPCDRSLDMLVSRLRKRLGPRQDGGERIKAVRGEGYVYILAGGQ